jgi:CheY-like chemotaxis protein
VDDAGDVRDWFQEMAKSLGMIPAIAASGEEALRLVRESGPRDVAFIDWRMPGMNGVETAARLREESPGLAVIMTSAADWDQVAPEAKRVGVDCFLAKPLFLTNLIHCLEQCFPAPDACAEGGEGACLEDGEAPRESFEGFYALLAEDVPVNREIAWDLFAMIGLKADSAENGKEAAEMFRAAPDRYDVIFMDVQMPEMDGYEATRIIRAMDLPKAKTIPIIAMTANVFREDVEKCFAAGMNAHTGKPLDLDAIRACLSTCLGQDK